MKKNYAYYWRAVNVLYKIHQTLRTVVRLAAYLIMSRMLVSVGERFKCVQIVVRITEK